MAHNRLVGKELSHSITLPYQRPQGFAMDLLMAMGSLKMRHRGPMCAKQQIPSTMVAAKGNDIGKHNQSKPHWAMEMSICPSAPPPPSSPKPHPHVPPPQVNT